MQRLVSFIPILIAIALSEIVAQDITEETLFVEAPVLLETTLVVPENISADGPVTLVIGLHGGGSSAEAFKNVWADIAGADFLYLALNGPYAIPNAEDPMYDWALWAKADSSLMKRAAGLLPGYLQSAIETIRDQYNVGSVYLSGFSQGAIYSYFVGLTAPDLVDGLLIFGGPELLAPLQSPFISEPVLPGWISKSHIEGASSLRIFIAHGLSDPATTFDMAEHSRDLLTEHGYDVTFRSFEGGHQLPPVEILEEAAEWILRKQ